ncbi:hypothetical protein HME01_00870 [Vreelandella aquamarina]|nr:hypothetical protein HME01_00870 [Halomonas meridiana]
MRLLALLAAELLLDDAVLAVLLSGTLMICPTRNAVGEVPWLALWIRPVVVLKCLAIPEKVSPGRI